MGGHIREEMATFLQENFNLNTFVETGTYRGGTTIWAAEHFDEVFTIETYPPFYEKVLGELGHLNNVQFILGDSRIEIIKILQKIDGPALLWLDAHLTANSKDLAKKTGDECPLREELIAIVNSGQKHFIMIDDAKFFTGKPPVSPESGQWPTFDEIATILGGWDIRVYYDVIVAIPQKSAALVWKYFWGE